MMDPKIFIFYGLLLYTVSGDQAVIKSLTLQNNIWTLHDGIVSDCTAFGNFTDALSSTGWTFLEVTTNSSYADEQQAYAAGVLEAQMTATLINNHMQNTVAGYCTKKGVAYCKKLQSFLQRNLDWMNYMFSVADDTDSYWHQLKLLMIQINGVSDGHRGRQGGPRTSIAPEDYFSYYILQVSGDLEDLEAKFGSDVKSRPLGGGSCSALIKLLPEYSDVYVAHDTWSGYESMLRVLKRYDFAYRRSQADHESVSSAIMTFSSYPGVILSGDDYYLLSDQMVTQETTIGNNNQSLWQYVQPLSSVMEGFRSVIANRLASSGKEWAAWFSRYNSGTYNNEWMIVDYKHFRPGHKPSDGLLTVLDQIPTMIHVEDLTELLIKQMYFPSYNIPYFPDVFVLSGVPALVQQYGEWFAYDTSPRARIFRRGQSDVNDMSDMIKLMRYNDFEHDPFSRCNCTPPYSGENGISARSDLNPANGSYPFGALGHRAHGAVDMKVTNFYLSDKLQFISQAGPTFDQQPPFRWSTSGFPLSHVGHPDIFQFEPITHAWSRGRV